MADVIYTQYRPNPWSKVFDPLLRQMDDKRDKQFSAGQAEKSREFAADQAEKTRAHNTNNAQRIEKINFMNNRWKEVIAGDVPGPIMPMLIETLNGMAQQVYGNNVDTSNAFNDPTKSFNSITKELEQQGQRLAVEEKGREMAETARQRDLAEKHETENRQLAVEKAETDIAATRAGTARDIAATGAVDVLKPTEQLRQQDAAKDLAFEEEVGMTIKKYEARIEETGISDLTEEQMNELNYLNKKYKLGYDDYKWGDEGAFTFIKQPQAQPRETVKPKAETPAEAIARRKRERGL